MSHIYTLEQEGLQATPNASAADVRAALESIHSRTRSFLILERSDGSYVQTAGARLRLMVEHRRVLPDGSFRHYVLGVPGGEQREVSINYSGGALTLRKGQVLTIKDALAVFLAFLHDGTVPNDYKLEDVTARFDD